MSGLRGLICFLLITAPAPLWAQEKDPAKPGKALVEPLASEDPELRERAQADLEARGAKALPELKELLQHKDSWPRLVALRCLALLKSDGASATKAVIAQLSHERTAIRIYAAKALYHFGEAAIPELVKALETSDENLQVLVLNALARQHKVAAPAVPAVLKILKADKIRAKIAAVRLCEAIAAPAHSVTPTLIELLKGDNKVLVRAAFAALFQMGEKSVPELIKGLSSKVFNVRYVCTRVLGYLGPKSGAAVKAIMANLGDKNKDIVIASISALRRIGPASKAAIPVLVGMLKSASHGVRNSLESNLARYGELAIKELMAAFKAGNSTEKCVLARIMTNMGAPAAPATPLLMRELTQKEYWVRRHCTDALAAIGPGASGAIPALIERLLNDKAVEIRKAAAKALGNMGAKGHVAVPALIGSLNDDFEVFEVSLRALRKLEPMPRSTLRYMAELVVQGRDEKKKKALTAWMSKTKTKTKTKKQAKKLK